MNVVFPYYSNIDTQGLLYTYLNNYANLIRNCDHLKLKKAGSDDTKRLDLC